MQNNNDISLKLDQIINDMSKRSSKAIASIVSGYEKFEAHQLPLEHIWNVPNVYKSLYDAERIKLELKIMNSDDDITLYLQVYYASYIEGDSHYSFDVFLQSFNSTNILNTPIYELISTLIEEPTTISGTNVSLYTLLKTYYYYRILSYVFNPKYTIASNDQLDAFDSKNIHMNMIYLFNLYNYAGIEDGLSEPNITHAFYEFEELIESTLIGTTFTESNLMEMLEIDNVYKYFIDNYVNIETPKFITATLLSFHSKDMLLDILNDTTQYQDYADTFSIVVPYEDIDDGYNDSDDGYYSDSPIKDESSISIYNNYSPLKNNDDSDDLKPLNHLEKHYPKYSSKQSNYFATPKTKSMYNYKPVKPKASSGAIAVYPDTLSIIS